MNYEITFDSEKFTPTQSLKIKVVQQNLTNWYKQFDRNSNKTVHL